MVSNKLKTGIVLSGGIAKGAYQIGFLKALKEAEIFDVTAFSSASIGTLNSYAFLTGKLSLAEAIWTNVNIKSTREVYSNLLKNYRIYELIDSICNSDDIISSHLYTVITTSHYAKPRYVCINDLDYSDKLEFMKASVSFLPVMKPVFIDGMSFFDGAIVDNTPLSTA